MNVFFVRRSENSKTGDIPQTYSPSSTCPTSCPLKGAGCYAEYGHVGLHWKSLDQGKKGIPWSEFLKEIRRLPGGQLWRHNIAGDLPGDGKLIDGKALAELVQANRGRRGFSFTHHRMDLEENRFHVEHANRNGFTVNLSATTLDEAQALLDTKAGPVVMVMPADPAKWPTKAADGTRIVPCLATTHEGRNCLSCAWCAKPERKFVVGFPAHGTGKKRAESNFYGESD